MRVLLFGSGGHIGSAIAAELVRRGHDVTGVTRTGSRTPETPDGVSVVRGDARDAGEVAELVAGHDVVASAIGPKVGVENDREIIVGATLGLIGGLRKAQVTRLVALGGAGSLRRPDGNLVVDSAHFPAMWKSNALAQAEALALYRDVDDLDWTFVSPAAQIEPGEATGTFRVGGDDLLVDADGQSRISIPDFAIAFVDEIEQGKALRRRISVAY